MADNIVKVGVQVSDNGTSAKTTKNVEKLKDVLDQTKVSATAAGKAIGSMSGGGRGPSAAQTRATESQASQSYGIARGAIGTGAEGRDFAKQSQGLGGLVRLYATFAANLFAAEAGFRALSNAMDTSNMVRGLDQLGARSGVALGSLAKDLVKTTDGAVSLREAMEATAKSTSAGLSSQQVLRLGDAAKKASQALGLSMPDALSRLSRGISKIEPELLDELGIYVKIDDAVRKYAISLGKPASALTEFERRQAFANAVLDQAEKKFSSIDIEANPYSKLSASLANLAQSGLEVVNKVLGPLINVLSESPLALAGVIGLIAKTLLNQAIPALGQWREGLKQQNAAALENIQTLQKQRAAYRNVIDEQVIQDLTSKNSIATQNSLAKAQEISANTKLQTLKKLTAQVPTKAIGEQAEIDNLKKLQIETAKYVRELEKRQQKEIAAGKAVNVQRQFEIDKTKELIALLQQQTITAQNIQKEEGKTPVKIGLLEKLFSKQEIDAKQAAAAERRAISTNILQNVGRTYDAAGFAEGWRQLNKEVAAGREGFKVVEGQLVKTDAKLTAFQAGLARTRGAIVLLTGVLGTLSSVVNSVFAAVATAMLVFETLSFFFSRNGKEADAANEAISRLNDAIKTSVSVIDEIQRKDPLERMSTESIMARATAFKNLADSVETSLQKVKVAIDSAGIFDFITEGVKGFVNKDIISVQAKQFAETVSQSLKLAPEGRSKEEAKARLYNILGVNPEDVKAIQELSPNWQLQQKAIDQGLKPLSKAITETAGKAQDLDEAFKKAGNTLDQLLISALPTDQMGKLGQDFVNLGVKLAEAFKDPNTAANQLLKTADDFSRLRFFNPQLQKDLVSQASNIENFVTEINIANTALNELQKDQERLSKDRKQFFASSPYGKESLDLQDESNKQAQLSFIQRRKEAESSIKVLSDKFLKDSLTIFQKGAELINNSIAIGYQKASLITRNALAQALGDTLGGIELRADLQKQQIDLDTAQIRSTISLIESNEKLRLVMQESNLIELRKKAETKLLAPGENTEAVTDIINIGRRESNIRLQQELVGKTSAELAQIIAEGAAQPKAGKVLPSFVTDISPRGEKLARAEAAKELLAARQAIEALEAQLAGKSAEKTAIDIGLQLQTLEKIAQIKKAELQLDASNINNEKTLFDLQTSSYQYLTDETLEKKLQLDYDALANKQAQETLDINLKIDKARKQRDEGKTPEDRQRALQSLSEFENEAERLRTRQAGERNVLYAQGDSQRLSNAQKLSNVLQTQNTAVIEAQNQIDTLNKDSQTEELNFQNQKLDYLRSIDAITEDQYNQQKRLNDLKATELEYASRLQQIESDTSTKVADSLQKIRNLQQQPDTTENRQEIDRLRALIQSTFEVRDAQIQSAETAKRLRTEGINLSSSMDERTRKYADLFKQSVASMGDAIVDFALTGKQSFGDMIKSMIAQLIKLEYQMQITKAFSAFGGFSGVLGSILPSLFSTGPELLGGPNMVEAVPRNALGAAYSSGVEVFAKGGAFTNTIVTKPTMFAFAKGAGLMGEAGPEAIMPLKRGPNGSLGVQGGQPAKVDVVVNNYSQAQATTRETQDARGNRKIEVIIGEMAAAELQRPNSPMQNTMRGTFGVTPMLTRR